jgi:hypothetical protein
VRVLLVFIISSTTARSELYELGCATGRSSPSQHSRSLSGWHCQAARVTQRTDDVTATDTQLVLVIREDPCVLKFEFDTPSVLKFKVDTLVKLSLARCGTGPA